jgi:hypothetical protein
MTVINATYPTPYYNAVQFPDTTVQGATDQIQMYAVAGGPVNTGAWFFPNIAIPKGAVINSCHFYPYSIDGAVSDANFNIYFEKVASPAALQSLNNNLSNRVKTTNTVLWSEDDVSPSPGYPESPDLSVPLQELVDTYTTNGIIIIGIPRTNATKYFNTGYTIPNPFISAKFYIEYNIILNTENQIVTGLRHIYNRKQDDLEITFGGYSTAEDILAPEIMKIVEEATIPQLTEPPKVKPLFGGGESGGSGATRKW